MLSPLPRHGDWVHPLLASPVVSAFPDMAVGSARASTFSRLIRRSLALRPAHSRCHHFVTRITEGFNYFVTSTVAPVASGWSICRVGFSPTGKRRLFTAHANCGPSTKNSPNEKGTDQPIADRPQNVTKRNNISPDMTPTGVRYSLIRAACRRQRRWVRRALADIPPRRSHPPPVASPAARR
jgi:hypothetical protein